MRDRRMTKAVAVVATAAIGLLSQGAAPAQAAYPGENGRIAFTRVTCSFPNPCSTNIYTVTRLGTDVTQITFTGDAEHPVWAPDGEHIAFARADGIYTMDEKGADVQPLLPWSLGVGRISWSPDGTKLAATLGVCDEDCRMDIHTFNADGTGLVNLTPALLSETNPAWAPDGSKIAYDSPRNSSLAVYTMNPDGSGETQLTNTVSDSWPSWSPDSSRIAFTTQRHGGVDLYSMKADGTDQTRLTNHSPSEMPAYSPEGDQIAFRGTRPVPGQPFTESGIFRMNALGGSAVPTATGTDLRFEPDWQPGVGEADVQGFYPRPKGATPLVAHFVPAYKVCEVESATTEHGPPLAYPSCPPVQSSPRLTIGTADSNGRRTRGLSPMRMTVYAGEPTTSNDEADVGVALGVHDVYRTSDLTEYTGFLELRMSLRITDRENVPVVGNDAGGTVEDVEIGVPVECFSTADPEAGGVCGVDTTLDSLVPGTVKEKSRGVWQLGQLQIYDGGADDDIDTEPNDIFQVQGVFVP